MLSSTSSLDSLLFNKIAKRDVSSYILGIPDALAPHCYINHIIDYVTKEFESIINCPSVNKSSSYSYNSNSYYNQKYHHSNYHRYNNLPSPPLSSLYKQTQTNYNNSQPITPPQSSRHYHQPKKTTTSTKPPMSLRLFIENVVKNSRVDTGTLLISLSYARRLRSKLYHTSKGMECTHHRIFLATLIITYKYIHDSTIKNKYWVGYSLDIFSNTEINLMEKQLLQLLDYNLEISIKDFELIGQEIIQLHQSNHSYLYPVTPPDDEQYDSIALANQSNSTNKFTCSNNNLISNVIHSFT